MQKQNTALKTKQTPAAPSRAFDGGPSKESPLGGGCLLESSIGTCCPPHSREPWRQMLQRSVVSEAAFCPGLPTAMESNRIRSLYLCLRQVWERSCVHPCSYLWCFGPPGSGWDQNGPAALSLLRWQCGCSQAAGEAAAAAANRCRQQPAGSHLAATLPPRQRWDLHGSEGAQPQSKPAPGSWRRGEAAGAGARDAGMARAALILYAWTSMTWSRTSIQPWILHMSPVRPPRHGRGVFDLQNKCAWLWV